MKRWLIGLALAVSLSPVLAQGQLVVGYEADATSLDPAQVTDLNSMHVLAQMYETLVQFGPDGQLEPALATHWTISPDGLTYTFTLRADARFSNGDPVTAEAVQFSFMRQLDEGAPGAQYGPFPFGRFFFGAVESVRALDPTTVEFRLSSPNYALLNVLTLHTGAVVNPGLALAEGENFALVGGGSGPYRLERWTRGGDLVLQRNPYYAGRAAPIERLVFVPIVAAAGRTIALQAGTVDLVINPPPENLELLRGAGFTVATAPGPHVWWVGMNLTRPPFDNRLVRQALNYAIDREAIIQGILHDTAVPSNQPLAPGTLGHSADATAYTYDPQRARELLAQAGYPQGFTATFLVPTSGSGMQSPVAMGTALQAYWAAVGVRVNIEQLDWGTFLGRIAQGAELGNLEMWQLSWFNISLDPSYVYGPLLSSASWPPGFNTGFYKNEEVDRLIEQGVVERDPAQRRQIYERASELVSYDAPWVFVNHGKQVVVFNPRTVSRFELHPAEPFLLRLWNAEVR
jgi:peptide/nickel transport system substrate-binding protein